MMSFKITLSAVLCAAMLGLSHSAAAQNLYKQSPRKRSLIADHRASQVGDILTITVDEAHSVRNEDKVDRKNESSLAARMEEITR